MQQRGRVSVCEGGVIGFTSSLQLSHQRFHGRQEAGVKLLVGETVYRPSSIAPDLQPCRRRQCQDGLHGCSIAVLAVGQEASLSTLVGIHDVQLGDAGLVNQESLQPYILRQKRRGGRVGTGITSLAFTILV